MGPIVEAQLLNAVSSWKVMMDRRNSLLGLFIALTIVFAAISIIEGQRGGSPSGITGGCVQTGFGGELIVRVVSDGSGNPIIGVNVTAIILGYCQTPAFILNTVKTNSTGYAMVPGSWVGNYAVTVAYGGRTYDFLASTGVSVVLATLNIPSGVSNQTTIALMGFSQTSP